MIYARIAMILFISLLVFAFGNAIHLSPNWTFAWGALIISASMWATA